MLPLKKLKGTSHIIFFCFICHPIFKALMFWAFVLGLKVLPPRPHVNTAATWALMGLPSFLTKNFACSMVLVPGEGVLFPMRSEVAIPRTNVLGQPLW